MLGNLATSLILYEKLITTASKAKEAKNLVDKYITLGKEQGLNSRRRLIALLPDKAAAAKTQEVLGPRYKKINGSAVRIFNLGPRLGDGAPMAMVMLKQEEKEIPLDSQVIKRDKGKNESAKANKNP